MNNSVQPSEIDWAQLAAYIDGEGCITILTAKSKRWKRHHLYVSLSVHNTDIRLIAWLQATFGGKTYVMRRANPKWSTGHSWNVSCRRAAEVLVACLPYFKIKRGQAEKALALQATMKRWGVKGAPQSVIDEQWTLKAQLTQMKGTAARGKLTNPNVPGSLIN